MQPNFDSMLEKDILRLSKEVKRHREALPSQEISPREIIKSAIGAQIQSQTAPAIPQDAQSPVLPQYLQQESPEMQLKVEELVDLAFHKGIEASVKEARKYGPFILDAFHDSLTGKIYEELKVRKIL